MRLIDADHVLKALSVFNDYEHGNRHFLSGIETAREIIDDAPTVDAVKHGHDTGKDRYFHCSVCGYGVSDVYESGISNVYIFEHGKSWRYCPNCGAKMDEDEPKFSGYPCEKDEDGTTWYAW